MLFGILLEHRTKYRDGDKLFGTERGLLKWTTTCPKETEEKENKDNLSAHQKPAKQLMTSKSKGQKPYPETNEA